MYVPRRRFPLDFSSWQLNSLMINIYLPSPNGYLFLKTGCDTAPFN